MSLDEELKSLLDVKSIAEFDCRKPFKSLEAAEFHTNFGVDFAGNPRPCPVHLKWPHMAILVYSSADLVDSEPEVGAWRDIVTFHEACRFIDQFKWSRLEVQTSLYRYSLPAGLLERLVAAGAFSRFIGGV